MPSTESRSSFWRTLGMFICVLVLGLPLAVVFTHGMILLPLLIVAVLAPYAAIHYLLWGWWLSPRPGEAERATDLTDFSNKPRPWRHADGIRSKELRERYSR